MTNNNAMIDNADRWIACCNVRDLEGLSEITAEELEVHGPKGTATIDKTGLKEWMERAKLKLETFEHYTRDNKVVMGQHGTWLHTDGTIKGEQDVYTVLVFDGEKVSALGRFDDKEQAFDVTGLEEGDRIG